MVRTDHYAVKFMLGQRLSTIPQHHWISKLFGFDFSVEFRPGKLNTVADTLSRRDSTQGLLALVSGPTFSFFDELHMELQEEEGLRQLRDNISTVCGEPWHVEAQP